MELELDMPKYLRRVIVPLGIILMIGVATTERLAAQSIFRELRDGFEGLLQPGHPRQRSHRGMLVCT